MTFQKDADRTRGDDFGDSSDHGSEISGSLGRDTKVDRSLSAAWHPLSGADHPRTYRVLRTTEGNGWREFAAKRAGVSINLDRGDTSMTSAPRGGRGGNPKREDSSDKVHDWNSDEGEGQKIQNFEVVN